MKKLFPVMLLTLWPFCWTFAETQLQTPWVDQVYQNNHGPVESVLVIGVPDHPDERRQLENTFVEVLSNEGVTAIASLDVMSEDTEIDEQTVKAALADRNVEAVLLTRVFRVDNVEIVQGGDPGTRRTERDFAIQLWDNYEGARDHALNAPKHAEQRLVLENNLYDLQSAAMVWSVQSFTMNPKSSKKIIDSLSKLITERLKKDNLI